jgi:predicted outer membrane repeat protein
MTGKRRIETSAARALLTLLAAAGLSQPALAATYKVGADGIPPCTHSTLSTALLSAALSPEDDVIQIARNQSYTNEYLHLTNWDPDTTGRLRLEGGYDTCSDTTRSGLTTIDGTVSNPVVEVDDTGGATSEVTLRNLRLTGGTRGVVADGNVDVELGFSVVDLNQAGVDAINGATLLVRNSTISTNTVVVSQGGGLRCVGSNVVLQFATIIGNGATSGGGIYTNACDIELRNRIDLSSNTATNGGGLYATGASEIDTAESFWLLYDMTVSNNVASSNGGGIYVTGDSVVRLYNGRVVDNTATNAGGGIYATNQGGVLMRRIDDIADRCNTARCVELSGNRLTTGVLGSAAYLSDEGAMTFARGFVEENSDAFSAGFALYAVDAGTTLALEGAQLWNNTTNALWYVTNSAFVYATYVSAARNHWNSPEEPAKGGTITSGATMTLGASALWDIASWNTSSAGTINVACVTAETNTGLGASTETFDPLFLDPANADLHLPPSSPAVDYCDSVLPFFLDVDGDARGYDHQDNANGAPGAPAGIFDLGFDEVLYFFYDGFESGDTSAWSASVP